MVLRVCKTVHWFPSALTIISIGGLAIVFAIAALRNDVSPYVPFISEAGAYPPESGIFSLFLDISATLGILIVILRYLVVEECIQNSRMLLRIINKLSLAVGIIAMLGMMIVAAYPMVSILTAHGIGAFSLFTGSIIYGFLHAWISYKMYPTYNSIKICHTRLFLAILVTLAYVTTFTCVSIGRKEWNKVKHPHWTGQKTPQDKGFDLLVVSATAEWVMALLSIVYFFTFVKEFSKVAIHMDVRLLVSHFDEAVQVARSDESSVTPSVQPTEEER